MRQLLMGLFLFLAISGFAQKRITGIVKDANKGSVLFRASVFLNNTSVGTVTDEQGRFVLWIPSGKFELVVSSIGYATYQQPLSSGTLDSLEIRLHPRASEMEAVVVEAFEKEGWKKWGRFFLEQFIGMSAFAGDCRLLNPDVLRFRLSEKGKLLTVIAKEPLYIENKALGYRIRYQMEEFSYSFNDKLLFYAGFPFFEPMKGSANRQQKWAEKRKEVYLGSVLHFMRALHAGTYLDEGFEVRAMQKHPNLEKQRVRDVYRRQFIQSNTVNMGGDSAGYYSNVLKQPDLLTNIEKELLTKDRLGTMGDSSAFQLNFSDFLHVWYKKSDAPFEYRQVLPESGGQRMSELQQTSEKAIEVWSNGSYFHPTNLIFGGFWGWWEKMATMLPLDYLL